MDESIDNLKQHHDTIIAKLQDISDRDYKTKTELVKELIAVSRPLIKSGLIKGLKQKDLATYINAKLIENGIKYVRNERFYDLFTENEKHSEYGSKLSSTTVRAHEHNFVGTENEKKCECGDMIVYGKHYTPAAVEIDDEPETTHYDIDMTEKKIKDEVDPYANLNLGGNKNITFGIKGAVKTDYNKIKDISLQGSVKFKLPVKNKSQVVGV